MKRPAHRRDYGGRGPEEEAAAEAIAVEAATRILDDAPTSIVFVSS